MTAERQKFVNIFTINKEKNTKDIYDKYTLYVYEENLYNHTNLHTF